MQRAEAEMAAALHGLERVWRERGEAWAARLGRTPGAVYAESLALGVLAGAVILAAGAGGEFIYFQF